MAYFPKKKRVARKGKKVVRRRNRRGNKGLVKMVKKIISSNVENKMRQSGGVTSLVPTNATGFQTGAVIPLSPYYEAGLSLAQNLDITQGTGVSNRIGNSIKTRSGYLRAVIYPAPYHATFNPTPQPLLVTQWIFKLKSGITDSTSSVVSTMNTNWFKDQNSYTGVFNSLNDVVMKCNPDFVNLLSRRVYKLGYASDNGTGSQVANQYHANNDYKLNFVLKQNMTKYLRKQIRYADNNAQPLTSTTWCVFTVAYASGQSMPSTHVPAYINWEYDYQFEDA